MNGYTFHGNPNGNLTADLGATGKDVDTGNIFICSGGSVWVGIFASGNPSGAWGGLVTSPTPSPSPVNITVNVSPDQSYPENPINEEIKAPDYYTWCEFKNEVAALMPQDANRLGMEDYLPRLIREAVIDLQQFIPAYRKRHETLYYPTDMVRDGAASVGTLPPQCELAGVWLFRFRGSERFEVQRYPWERRFELVHARRHNDELGTSLMTLTASSVAAIELINRLPQSSAGVRRYGLMSVDPQGDTFYLHPALENGWVLSVNWNGRKLDYRDDELVPFEEPATYAVASWAKSKIAMEVDRDLQRSAAFFAEYAQKRVNLFTELKEMSRNI